MAMANFETVDTNDGVTYKSLFEVLFMHLNISAALKENASDEGDLGSVMLHEQQELSFSHLLDHFYDSLVEVCGEEQAETLINEWTAEVKQAAIESLVGSFEVPDDLSELGND